MTLFDATPATRAEIDAHRAAERAQAGPVPGWVWFGVGCVVGWAVAFLLAFRLGQWACAEELARPEELRFVRIGQL